MLASTRSSQANSIRAVNLARLMRGGRGVMRKLNRQVVAGLRACNNSKKLSLDRSRCLLCGRLHPSVTYVP